MQNKRYAFSQYKVKKASKYTQRICLLRRKIIKAIENHLIVFIHPALFRWNSAEKRKLRWKTFWKEKEKTIKEEDSRSFGCSEAERTQRSF